MDSKIIIQEEKILKPASGLAALLILIILSLLCLVLTIFGAIIMEEWESYFGLGVFSLVIGILGLCIFPMGFSGLKSVNPNEALVLVLFGKYYGTIYTSGFYYVNPFCIAINPTATATNSNSTTAGSGSVSVNLTNTGKLNKKVSLKVSTLNNEVQKVNDEIGNPIMIGAVVFWKVQNATKAVFNVENYLTYISTQCDAVIRNTARCYPYDSIRDEGSTINELTLRASSQEIANVMQEDLQEKVIDAGIEIIDVRITHLAYAPEIAAAMLQRQQASAIIDARQKIVEGAVGMVEMALNKLSNNNIVHLDEERKAAMVSNLLVVLCGNKDAQPVINNGSLY